MTVSISASATNTGALQVNNVSIATFDSTGNITFTGQVGSIGTGQALLTPSGDILASRAGGATGVIYFGTSGVRYLYYDGANYVMPNTNLYVNGYNALTMGNFLTHATVASAFNTWITNTYGYPLHISAGFVWTNSATYLTPAILLSANGGVTNFIGAAGILYNGTAGASCGATAICPPGWSYYVGTNGTAGQFIYTYY